MTLPFDEPAPAPDESLPADAVRRLVVEADGGSRGNPGPAAYGALVRDPITGRVLAERAEYLGETTNNVAEYSGLVAGLSAAKAIDPEATVEARLDSNLVVQQMSGRWKIKHEDMRRLALQARAIFPPDRVSYTWVPRAENSAADRLANLAMDAAAEGRTFTPSEAAYAGDVSQTAPPEATPPATAPATAPATPSTADDTAAPPRLSYRLLSGGDDRAFCERVSKALAEGYQLHGGPAITFDGSKVVVAQAVVDPRMLGFGS